MPETQDARHLADCMAGTKAQRERGRGEVGRSWHVALTDVYMDFFHPRIDDGVLGARRGRRVVAVGRLADSGGGRRRAGRHRVAAVVQLGDGGRLQPGRGEDVTPRGHHHRSGLPRTLARRVRWFSVLLGVVLVPRVVLVVVEGVRLKGGGSLLPLGAVVVRRVAGQIVAL